MAKHVRVGGPLEYPQGGERGGELVAQGTPEEIVRVQSSHTARYLQPVLEGSHGAPAPLSRARKAVARER
jgi:excinuclease ABC subunit A